MTTVWTVEGKVGKDVEIILYFIQFMSFMRPNEHHPCCVWCGCERIKYMKDKLKQVQNYYLKGKTFGTVLWSLRGQKMEIFFF